MTKTIVSYFSSTGTTKQLAEIIANKLAAEMVELKALKPYTPADLNWHDEQARTTIEQHEHHSRVPVDPQTLPDLTGYDQVIIGHPIWWGIPPRLISDTIDHLDLNGKVLAPFATSGGSTYARSQSFIERTIQENNYQTTVKSGQILHNANDIDQWLKAINFI